MLSRIAFLSILAALFAAAPAGAATLTRDGASLRYTAAPEIANDVTVTADPGPPPTVAIHTTDDPVPYPLPADCDDIDGSPNASPAGRVECDGVTALTVDLGDRNDNGTTSGTGIGLTWLGNTGNDDIVGAAGGETLDGGAGDDSLNGSGGADIVRGGDGSDTLMSGEGADDADGGAGQDFLIETDSPDKDVLRGGGGADYIVGVADTVNDVFDGGDGIDTFLYFADVPLFVDLTAGKAGTANESDSISGLEDLNQEFGEGPLVELAVVADATVTGDAGVNSIGTSSGADKIDPAAGNDLVFSRGGDDVIELRDGFADRVTCGDGADTVRADTLDVVADDCETVERTDRGNAGDVPEDRPPTVTITAPAPGATLSTTASNTITADVKDDRGIAQVIFSSGERNLCVDTTAPYSCDYRPTAADVGRDTLVVIAVDTAQQTASAVRVVSVPRFKPVGLTAKTTPARDRTAPFRFTTRGKLTLPGGVSAAAGCQGTVSVSFKAGKKTVSTRRVAIKPDCTYSSRVTFRLPRRLNPKTLTVVPVFGGNAVLDGVRGPRRTVRPR